MKLPLFSLKLLAALLTLALIGAIPTALALSRLTAGRAQAESLARGAVEEAVLLARLERQALLTASNIRGYALTSDRRFLDEAKKELAAVSDELQRVLSVTTKAQAGQAEWAERDKIGYLVEDYKKLAEMTVAVNQAVITARTDFEAALAHFEKNARALSDLEAAALERELSAKYPAPDKLRTLSRRKALAEEALALVPVVRAAAQTAKAEREPRFLREAVNALEPVRESLAGLGPQGEEAQKALAEARQALAEVQKAGADLLGEWRMLQETGRKLAEAERSLLAAARSGADQARVRAEEGFANLSGHLSDSAMVLRIVALAGALMALAVIVLTVSRLGLPVWRLAAYAGHLVKGNLHKTLSVSGRDECGQLAESLREIARRIGRSWAR